MQFPLLIKAAIITAVLWLTMSVSDAEEKEDGSEEEETPPQQAPASGPAIARSQEDSAALEATIREILEDAEPDALSEAESLMRQDSAQEGSMAILQRPQLLWRMAVAIDASEDKAKVMALVPRVLCTQGERLPDASFPGMPSLRSAFLDWCSEQ